ncbi:recombination mediator RecR [Pararhodospirillum oryzae]|uniref:Recombination protein RecR n=1 Tax=Pararhodospirillum oryzae TaxID=478448 RepID=A0A512H991_9PROT|nr:recombination mediator RecR [Pararhodospirillum oryzae]GEO82002.1 recombination protein RecR [Pararhodospirillum oryzae]
MPGEAIDRLIQTLARLPGLGPRSARRAVLVLLRRRAALLEPLRDALALVAETARDCPVCGNIDTTTPCAVCADPGRDAGLICVVRDVADLWALERTGSFRGRYHVLGGLLSALDGIGPDDLGLERLEARLGPDQVREIILALPATVEGQTTAHVVADRLERPGLIVSGLAHGVPLGSELDYLDDGTLNAALTARRPLQG